MSLASLRPSTKARTTSSRPRTAGSAAAALEAAKAAGEALSGGGGGGRGVGGHLGFVFFFFLLGGSIKIKLSCPGHQYEGGRASSVNYSTRTELHNLQAHTLPEP